MAGNDYRVLVVGGRMAAVAQRMPASVVGDGGHTVRELVDIENADPRRGIGHEKVLTRIRLDTGGRAAAARTGADDRHGAASGKRVLLAATGNMSTGGTAIDRTHEAHPDNVEIAETAARVMGLDVAGIDFIVPDMAIPVREQGGAIVEVNAAPGLSDAHPPHSGRAAVRRQAGHRPALPDGSNARIPIVARHRHQRQDDDRAHDRPHPEADRPAGGHDHHRRHRHRRPADPQGRHARAALGQMVLQNPSVDTAVFEVPAAASCARAWATTATTWPW